MNRMTIVITWGRTTTVETEDRERGEKMMMMMSK